MGKYLDILFKLAVLLVTFEVLFIFSRITSIIFLLLLASRTAFLVFKLFSAMLDIVLIRGAVVVYES